MTKKEFLAMSLPYGLMFKNLNENTTEQLSGVDTYLVANWSHPSYPNGTICVYSSIDHSSMWSINEIKLILHPLSDLTKEIEHKGERFVPIVELAKIAFTNSRYSFKLSEGVDKFVWIDDDDWNNFQFYFDGVNFHFDGYGRFIPNQLHLFQKLIKWHFDIADLISKGEAIDVNTLEINPYK